MKGYYILCFYLRRFLSDRLGVLLHGGRGGGRHAAVRLVVVFRWEEAEALPVLKGHRGQSDRYGAAGTAVDAGHDLSDNCSDWLNMQQTHACTPTHAHTHRHMFTHARIHPALKTGSSSKSCSWMKNVWTNPTCKNVTSRIPLTKRVFASLDSCLFIYGCFFVMVPPPSPSSCDEEKKGDIASL